MANNVKKKVFLLVFCLATIVQGMYSTYFVSILTTIERIYQIQSKTAGAIMGSTEIGQILGSLLIAYYGGRGNKPKWIAACMTVTALAALISTSPHFILNSSPPPPPAAYTPSSPPLKSPYSTSDLTLVTAAVAGSTDLASAPSSSNFQLNPQKVLLPSAEQLCYLNTAEPLVMNSTSYPKPLATTLPTGSTANAPYVKQGSTSSILVIFFLCLLAIGFGSTAITTLGIPFIDDIVSKEESPLYLGLTIGLKIFGPALGFLLGSFCIRIDVNALTSSLVGSGGEDSLLPQNHSGVGAWWLGLIMIGLPQLLLALPMYYLSLSSSGSCYGDDDENDDFQDITYQAAEDHDIGGSTDFQPHVLTIGDLDVTSNGTCYSEVDSSSREVLQQQQQQQTTKTSSAPSQYLSFNFAKNISLDQPIVTRKSILNKAKQDDEADCLRTSCVVVNHFGGLESTSFTQDEAKSLRSSYSSSSSNHSSIPSATTITTSNEQSTMNLSGSLSRLIKNRLLLLRMLSGILHILPIAGFFTFLPKYLIEQFRIDPSSASAISGLAGILFVGIGAFLGGTIIRLLNINSKLMTRWIASSALLYAIGMLILMNLGCPQNQTVYFESIDYTSTDCLTTCNCSSSTYSPVCANGTTYLSPCLAGCKSYTISENKVLFDECGCSLRRDQPSSVPPLHHQQHHRLHPHQQHNHTHNSLNHLNLLQQQQQQHPLHHHHNKRWGAGEHALNLNVATQGHCLINCDNLIWYIVIFSTFTLLHASCEVGSMMFNLRCVKPNDRTLALGLITFSSSLLGTIPCSIIYGTVIDLTCVHWDTVAYAGDHLSEASKLNGACLAYRNDNFRYYLHGVTALVMFMAFLVDCIISRRAKEVDFYDRNDSRKEASSAGLQKSTETI